MSSSAEDLTSSLPVLIPPLCFAFLAGALFEVSPWLGCVIVALLISEFAAIRRIVTARNMTIKVLEVFLGGLSVPMLASLSVLASFYFPRAGTTLNLMLLAFTVPHLAVLWRVKIKVSNLARIVSSSLLLLCSLVSIPFLYARGVAATFPTVTVSIYSTTIICGTLLFPREKASIPDLRRSSAVLVALFLVSTIVCYFTEYPLFNGLLGVTVAAALLFAYFDWKYHAERVPIGWTKRSSYPLCALFIKLTAVVLIMSWTAQGSLMRITNKQPVHEALTFLNFCLLTIVHMVLPMLFIRFREEDPCLPDIQSIDKRTAIGLSATVSVVLAKIAIAGYYCLSAHPTVINETYLCLFVAVLFVVLFYLLDFNRQFLVPFYGVLFAAFTGAAVYLLVYAVVVFATSPTLPRNERKEQKMEPIEKVVFVAIFHCCSLALYYGFVFCVQAYKKKLIMIQLPVVAAVAAPAAGVAIIPAAIVRDVDSDYDSDETVEVAGPEAV